uniref:Uncharacterized protein n=1 Tax=Meloidogyne enterolobii TaxID=390850 RepID=A0A6V7V3F4_MELEN|nr:unnamed protein product [Meloidogyne enterolobii]
MTFTEAHYVLNFISKNLEQLNSNYVYSGMKVEIEKLKIKTSNNQTLKININLKSKIL